MTARISESKTKPPAAFTDGTLMSAMASAARYAKDPEVKRILQEKDADSEGENGSIGTVATRASIIEALIGHGYVTRQGNKLISTDLGRTFYALVPEQIKGVDLTARWWLIQQEVAAGRTDTAAVMRSVCEEYRAHADSAYAGLTLQTKVGTCPRCGEAVIAKKKSYTCSSNRYARTEDGAFTLESGCGFRIAPFSGRTLTVKQASALLAGKKVALKGLKSKQGRKYDCELVLDADSDYGCRPQFGDRKPADHRTRRKDGK